MTNTAMTSVLGVVFWVVAARLYSSSAVGRDSALISAMMAISVFCQLNLNNALARFLPVARSVPARMVALTYALTASISLLAAVGFVVFAPRWSAQFDFLRNDRALAVGFCISLPDRKSTSELQSRRDLVCRLLLEKKKKKHKRC